MKFKLLELAAKVFRAPKASAGKRIAIAGEPPTLSTSATVQWVQGAIRMAEQGETKNLFALYRDITVSGSHVFAELSKRKLAVLAQPHALMPANKTSSEDAAAVAAVTEMIARCDNWFDGLGHLLDATLWPVAVAEKIYGPAGEAMGDAPKLRYWLKRIEPVNPTLLCFKPIPGAAPSGGDEWESELRLYPVNEQGKVVYSSQDATNLEPDRHLVYRGHLMTGQRDCWGGPMRAIVFWWLLGGLGRDWFARYMERFGIPFQVGHTDIKDNEKVKLLEEALALSTKLGGIVVDVDTQMELKEAAVAQGADAHERFLNVCNREISKIILGQTLSAEAQATGLGSSVGDLQSNVREDIRAFDQLRLGDVLQRQLFEPFLRINGLTGAPPKIVWGGLSDEDAKLFADLLESLSRSGWEPTDEAADTVQERVGFPVQRKAAPAPVLPGGFGKKPEADNDPPDGGEPNAAPDGEPDEKPKKKPETLRAELSPRVRAGVRAYAAQQRVAVELGVPAGWLDPLRDWFRVLQAKVEDGQLSDAEVQTFVAEALNRLPELFGDMDHEALAKVLEVAMGQAVIEGVREGIAKKPRKAKKV